MAYRGEGSERPIRLSLDTAEDQKEETGKPTDVRGLSRVENCPACSPENLKDVFGRDKLGENRGNPCFVKLAKRRTKDLADDRQSSAHQPLEPGCRRGDKAKS